MPEQHPNQRVVDYHDLGGAIVAARNRRRMTEAEVRRELKERAGIEMSTRTYYAIERGERALMLDEMVALITILNPPAGWRFFEGTARQEFSEWFPPQA